MFLLIWRNHIMLRKLFLASFWFVLLVFFQSGYCVQEWKRISLASYPQSGNHWVRYLVEEASGIATSSVYRDPEPPRHMDKIFPWGGYCCDHGYSGTRRYPTQDEIVLVKTHYPYPYKTSQFDNLPTLLTIRIVRHPVDSFYSRYLKLPKGPVESLIPSERVKSLIKSWKNTQIYWNKRKHVITLRYEDLLLNPSAGLKKICKALKYQVTDQDIERAISKYPPEGFELKHLDKFRNEDLKLISRELKELLDQFNYKIPL